MIILLKLICNKDTIFNINVNYIFSLVSFNVLLNKNHGCNNNIPPMVYVIFGPTDQYTGKKKKKIRFTFYSENNY